MPILELEYDEATKERLEKMCTVLKIPNLYRLISWALTLLQRHSEAYAEGEGLYVKMNGEYKRIEFESE